MLLFLTYLKSENICTKRYFTAEKNAESIFFLTCRSAKHVAIWYQRGQKYKWDVRSEKVFKCDRMQLCDRRIFYGVGSTVSKHNRAG